MLQRNPFVSFLSQKKKKSEREIFFLDFSFFKFSFLLLFLIKKTYKDLGTIAGENAASYVGSPIGNLDLWSFLTDLQVSPDGTRFIFSDNAENKIRKIDFSTS